MEQLLKDNGWNRQASGAWQHRDGRVLEWHTGGWRLLPVKGKPKELARTLKGAIAKLGLDRKAVANA